MQTVWMVLLHCFCSDVVNIEGGCQSHTYIAQQHRQTGIVLSIANPLLIVFIVQLVPNADLKSCFCQKAQSF